ncbi:MAG TPA: ABC transporter permease [Vicinamibacterales bacterium]|nr:ABC transporter permease [Vicinamibacterales bacterium]
MKRSLRSWLWSVPLEQEVDDELAFHREMRARDGGPDSVDPALRRTLIGIGRTRDREMRVAQWVEEFLTDVRFALRQMRRAPAFSAIALLTLALGIGANSAIFALVDATVLRPLPFRQPDRLVTIWETTNADPRGTASPIDMLDWLERSRSLAQIGGFIRGVGSMVMDGGDVPDTYTRQWVSAGIFDVLGVHPLLGRTFHPADNDRREDMVVLSEDFWRTRFHSDPSVIGRRVRFDGDPYTVVGVMPQSFTLLGDTAMWALRWFPRLPQLRGAHGFQVVGRLGPGVTIAQAQADLASVAARLAREFPDTNTGRRVTVEPLHDVMIGDDLRLTSLLFIGVAGFVLLICCANIVNLLLARATVRTSELVIRSAVGAGRGRIVRQLVTESLVLATLGGALGIALGAGILEAAPSFVPAGLLPPVVTLTFNARVLAFCTLAILFVGILVGVAPAWQATGGSSVQAMAGEARTVTSHGGTLRGAIVVGEVAAAVLLLFGAGLLVRTLMAVDRGDRGYSSDRVLSMMVDPLDGRYPTPDALLQFFYGVEREVMSIPGMRSVAWSSTVPLGTAELDPTAFEIVGDPSVTADERPVAPYQVVSPGYFDTLGITVVDGRRFTTHDTRDSVPVCIVSESFVHRYAHGRSPIGMRVRLRPANAPAGSAPIVRQIVGVVGQVKDRPDEAGQPVQIYAPLAQNVQGDIYLLARSTSARAADLTTPVRAAIARADATKEVSVREAMTLDEVAWTATGRHRFRAVLAATLATLALVLAMIGVFGVLGYAVQQRWREFGVRIALGATSGTILRLVIASAARLVVTGMLIGLVAAAVAVRTISTFLFDVRPLDPVTFGAVVGVLATTAAAAIAAPALRAARVDPAVATRD